MASGPIFLGWPLATFGAAWMLQLGITGALLERERTGKGQVLTTSLLDGIAIMRNVNFVAGERIGSMSPPPKGKHSTYRLIVSLFECGDERWIQIHTGARGQFNRLMKAVGRHDLAIEFPNAGMFGGDPMTQEQADELWGYLETTFKTRPAQYWCDLLAEADVCGMPALLAGEALWLEQMEINGMVDILPDGERRLGKVGKFARTPMEVGREIPAPGQHNSILLVGGTDSQKRVSASSHNSTGAAAAPNRGETRRAAGRHYGPRLRLLHGGAVRQPHLRGPRRAGGVKKVEDIMAIRCAARTCRCCSGPIAANRVSRSI